MKKINDRQFAALQQKLDNCTNSHVAHAIVAVCTLGLWIPVWFILAILTSLQRSQYQRRIDKYAK